MSKQAKATRFHPIGAPVRGKGVFVESEHDPYRARSKPPEPTVCPQCRVFFHAGRWQWLASPPHGHAHQELCPACRRARDRYPAGYVTLDGDFFREHREILARVKHRADQARTEHPLQRVMAIQDQDSGVLITTTDTHLARGIGEALQDAYRGALRFRYEEGQERLRVHWTR